jgi:uncharacterized membrane protein
MGGKVPLGNLFNDSMWSLLNLIMAIIALVIAIRLIMDRLSRRKDESEQEEQEEEGSRVERHTALKIATMAVGLFIFLLVMLLEDFSQRMAWINQWTLMIGVVFAVQIVMLLVSREKKTAPETPTAPTQM